MRNSDVHHLTGSILSEQSNRQSLFIKYAANVYEFLDEHYYIASIMFTIIFFILQPSHIRGTVIYMPRIALHIGKL
jgi:hypothetical protein